jgi:hypothetical protein
MRLLITESDPYGGEAAERALRAAGHEVVNCFDRDRASFPCRALYEGRCPLDDAPVDAVVVVRSRRWPLPMPLERGVTCGLRSGAPLIVAGSIHGNPYRRWTTAYAADAGDVVAECERLPRRSAAWA